MALARGAEVLPALREVSNNWTWPKKEVTTEWRGQWRGHSEPHSHLTNQNATA